MSRGGTSGPPTYVFVDANESADRPQLSRGLASAWDLGPSLSSSPHRSSTSHLRGERYHSDRQLHTNLASYNTEHKMEGSNGHNAEVVPPRARRSFYIPGYLRQSRLARRLKQQHEKEMSKQQEQTHAAPSSHLGGLATSSSSTSLNRTAGHTATASASMFRGVAQKVVERFPPEQASDGDLTLLPTRWSEEDKAQGLDISEDGLDLRFSGHFKSQDEAASLRTDHPIPKEGGLFYYEVELRSKGKEGLIGLGLSRKSMPLARQPGWEAESFAYHGDDGFVYSGSSTGHAYGPRYSAGDTIGCGINFRTNCIFFTKNGVFLGNAFKDVKTDRLFPTVGLKRPGEHLRLNLGQTRFAFDIEGMMRQERGTVRSLILEQDTSALHPPDDERTLVRELIAQFLAHEGYVESSKAFAQDVRTLQSLAPTEKGRNTFTHDDADDKHAVYRQKIRMAVLDGKIDHALKFTRKHYPRVLEEKQNRDVYFRLRCRKFIEIMREYAEANESDGKVFNGGLHKPEDITQMELDDQIQRETSNGQLQFTSDDIDMDSSSEILSKRPSYTDQGDLLAAAIEYGQSLRADFDSDAQTKVLKDIFALMAYSDPRESPVGNLLDTNGRAGIAEDLNGAILVSLGKPASAALEKLCGQTITFLDLAASKVGGASAFVDVQSDFLEI